jgi:Mg-chelatase subunit ChlD
MKPIYVLLFAFILSCSSEKNEQHQESETIPVQPAALSSNDTTSIYSSHELVFCLDATGSMSGLISTAKEKIWDIVSAVSQDQTVEELKLGMIFYRDRGDAFVTKVYPLTLNIDSIYNELLEIGAAGGGDAPESVNLALDKAVNTLEWSSDSSVLKTLFLVGDCPPHMDYQQERKYPDICNAAVAKGITIHTIKLGVGCTSAIDHFKRIAQLTQGEFMHLDQNAEDVTYETPYDDSLIFYMNRIDESKIYYGSRSHKEVMYEKKGKSLSLYDKSSKAANSGRAYYNTTKSGKKNLYGSKELIHDLMKDKVKLEDIKEEKIPDELKSLNTEERTKKVKELIEERKVNIKKLEEYRLKKRDFIAEKKASDSTTTSFSDDVIKVIEKQKKK